MDFQVTKISDLLPLMANTSHPVAISSLSPADLTKYEKAASEFVKQWRTVYPDGLPIRVQIARLNPNPNKDGRVAIVLQPNDNFDATAITYPASIAATIAQSLGLPSFHGLNDILGMTAQAPSHVAMTVDLHLKGEEYSRADGTVAKYKSTGTHIVGRETIELSVQARQSIAALGMKVTEIEMINFRNAATAPAAAPVPVVVTDQDPLG